MLWLNGIEKSYGPQALFQDVDWQLNPKQRVGLIGPNGVGKSTLIKIIAGLIESDRGEMNHVRGMSIGYLPQDIAALTQNTIRQEASKGLSHIWQLQAKIDDIAESLSSQSSSPILADSLRDSSKKQDQLLDKYGEMQAEFERIGGFEANAKVEQILCGLGFRANELDADCATLSGGWQMRVILARLLLQQPDLLLLDEPTNHLDLESVAWLKHFLNSFEGTLILISHDRWFLNQICTHIAELSAQGLSVYTGHFDDYLKQAAQQQELLDKQRQSQARKQVALEKFIERFRYKASKAKQVQSRIKQLDKFNEIEQNQEVAHIHFQLDEPPKCGRVVLELSDVHQGYQNHHLLYQGLDLSIERGQHIALIGPNGAGKSTLLKILAGVVDCQRGEVRLGHMAKLYYFAQHQTESLILNNTVLTEAQSAKEGASITYLRSILGAFLFDQDDVKKKVAVLSGGEKNRLALVKMLLTPANVLLLDEPTNHLDMGSRAVLAEALRAFKGTVILISHDRYFIDEVCDETWEVQGGRVTPFLCSNEEYLEKSILGQRPAPFPLHGQALSSMISPSSDMHGATPQDQKSSTASTKRTNRKDERRQQAALQKERSKVLKPLQKKVSLWENKVEVLEKQISEFEVLQCDPKHYEDQEEILRVAHALKQVNQELEQAYQSWEDAQLTYEEAMASFEG
jgi:ATP-binding cassette, subfamily F, member 3